MSSPDENLQPIKYWFINPAPCGCAAIPQEVDHELAGVPLPLRYDRLAEGPEPNAFTPFGEDRSHFSDTVRISFADAIKAYRLFGRHKAAEWLMAHSMEHPDKTEMGFGTTNAVASRHIYPASFMERILPGIEEFDSLD